jgi:hypothetical protein
LVISRRDAQQNEMTVKRYMSKGDLEVFYCNLQIVNSRNII